MKELNHKENKAFHSVGSPTTRNTQSVSYPPLFIDARGKENKVEDIKWKRRIVCLQHGENFRWKKRCKHCRYMMSFQTRLN